MPINSDDLKKSVELPSLNGKRQKPNGGSDDRHTMCCVELPKSWELWNLPKLQHRPKLSLWIPSVIAFPVLLILWSIPRSPLPLPSVAYRCEDLCSRKKCSPTYQKLAMHFQLATVSHISIKRCYSLRMKSSYQQTILRIRLSSLKRQSLSIGETEES